MGDREPSEPQPPTAQRCRRATSTRSRTPLPTPSATPASPASPLPPSATGTALGRPLVVGINTWAGHAPGHRLQRRPRARADVALQAEVRPGREVRAARGSRRPSSPRSARATSTSCGTPSTTGPARRRSSPSRTSRPSRSSCRTGRAAATASSRWRRSTPSRSSQGQASPARSSRRRTSCCSTCWRSRGCRPKTAPAVEKNIIFTQDAPAAAAMFKAKQVDAAVTWEPDLSAAVEARGDEAHVLVSTTAATNIIADTLVRAAGRHRPGAGDPARLRARLVRRHRDDEAGPGRLVRRRRPRRSSSTPTPSPGCSPGLKLTPYADNAQFYGLTGGQGALRDALRHRLRHLAQEGAGDAAGGREGLGGHALPRARSPSTTRGSRWRSRSSRPRRPRPTTGPSSTSRSRSTSRRAPTRSCPARTSCSTPSGDTMTSFGNTYLRVEGNTDSTGSATSQHDALGAPGPGGQELHAEELPEHHRQPLPDHRPRVQRTRSRRTRPRRGASSTAAPTSRSSWRRGGLNERGERRQGGAAATPARPRSASATPLPRGVSRSALGLRGCRSLVLGAWCAAHLRRLGAAGLPALADRGGEGHAAALLSSRTSASAILVIDAAHRHRLPPGVGASRCRWAC